MAVKKKISSAAVVGVFETRAAAEAAVADLKASGFKDSQISIVGRDETRKVSKAEENDVKTEEGAAIGAAVGAGAGALVGLGLLPILGPVFAVGTLGTVLVNALGGATIAGIAGALIGWGIPEEDAKFYEAELKAGRYLVAVEKGKREKVYPIFERHGGYDRLSTLKVERTHDVIGGRGASVAPASVAATSDRTVEVKEEQLRAVTEPVHTGEVEVRKEVHTEHQQLTVPVEKEEVVITRRKVGGKRASKAVEAEEIRIPVKEERVHVSKETVVTEEVSVGKRKVKSQETVGGDVKKEKVVVKTAGKARVRNAEKKD